MEMRKRSGVPWIWRVEPFEGAAVAECFLCCLPSGTRGRRLCRLDRKTGDKEVDPAAAVAARGDSGAGPAAAGALPYETNMRGKHVMCENVAPLFGCNGACIFWYP